MKGSKAYSDIVRELHQRHYLVTLSKHIQKLYMGELIRETTQRL